MAKLNVDAAVGRGGRYGAVGAIARDVEGVFLGASTFFFPINGDPTVLECLTIIEGLALSDDLYERRIKVALDCKVVIDDICSKNLTSYGAIIHEVVAHKSTFISCILSHESRTSNVEAHKLAKHALSLPVGRHVWLG